MGIKRTEEADGKRVVIAVDGRFDFSLQREFRSAYEGSPPQAEYIIDLGRADYLDSSALGMLLLLRDYAGGDKSRIQIRGAGADVRRVLEIANFNRLFAIP